MPAAAIGLFAVLATAAIPSAPVAHVEDHAHFLSSQTVATLDHQLDAYELATGHQVVVWIGHSLGGEPLDEWAVKTFAAWKIGREGLDDGIALFVLADDHAIDIEVGYGLEAVVPDAIASRIIRDVMTPPLRTGEKDRAVTDGVNAILTAIEGKPWTPGAVRSSPGEPWWTWVLWGAIGLLGLWFVIRHPRAALLGFITAGRWGTGGGGGGFHGGGGRSGGGGARGRW